MPAKPSPAPALATAPRVLTRAAWRAAEILGLSQVQLAAVLGLSPASVSRLRAGSYLLDPTRKEWELALLWVRLFRSLDSITGAQDESSRAWLHSHNAALGAPPIEMAQSVAGLVRVVAYLDSSRARV